MKNKYLYYLIFGIITYFSLFLTVFAYSENLQGSQTVYGLALSEVRLTEQNYDSFKKYFNDFIESNNLGEKTCLLLRASNSYYYLMCGDFDFAEQFENGAKTMLPSAIDIFSFNVSIAADKVTVSRRTPTTSEKNNYLDSNFSNFFYSATYLVWSNKQLKIDNIDNTKTYRSWNVLIDDRLKIHYNFEQLSVSKPLYTYCNLLFGDYEIKEPVTVSYKVEYYFDDILDPGKTEYKTGKQYDVISSYEDYATDMYKLVDGSYSIILSEDESLNVLKIYYRSPLYGTEKSPIETKNQRVWFFFQFSDLKTIFPNVEFGNFTQYQQLVITILVNIFFCLFLLFISYITLKAVFKCWSWIMGFIT